VKLPFTFSREEVRAFQGADVRVGGFGPLFGGAMLLAAAVLALVPCVGTPPLRPWLVLPLALLASVLAHPHGWWARYAPQLWLVPASAVVLADLAARSRRPERLATVVRGAGTLLLLTLAADLVLVAAGHLSGQAQLARLHRAQVAHLRQVVDRSGPVQAAFGRFEATGRRLAELGIPFEELRTVSCPEPIRLATSEAVLCDRAAVTAVEPLRDRLVTDLRSLAGRWRGRLPGPDGSRNVTLVVQPDGRYAVLHGGAPALSGTLRLVRGAVWFPEVGVDARLRESPAGPVLAVHVGDTILELVPAP
jgi:hypothetical protein